MVSSACYGGLNHEHGLLKLIGIVRSVKKGQAIVIPIQALNRVPSIWGADAAEFKYFSRSYFAVSIR